MENRAAFLFFAIIIYLIGTNYSRAQPGYLNGERDPSADTVVIFVHGLGGAAVGTWSRGDVYWPSMVSKHLDNERINSNIYIHQYNSVLSNLSIDEIASNLGVTLENHSVIDGNIENVFFVTHSMGGIVIRDFLQDRPDVSEKTKAIFFYGTPTTGSTLANVVDAVIKRLPILRQIKLWFSGVQIEQLGKNGRQSYLALAARRWLRRARTRNIPAYCAYETKPAGVKVVEFDSAGMLCNQNLEAVDGDHFEIVKPDNEMHMAHQLFVKGVREQINKSREIPKKVRIAAVDSFEYGNAKNQIAAKLQGTNADEIKDALTENGDFSRDEIFEFSAQPTTWKSESLRSLKPELIFMHWSTFELKSAGEDCNVSVSHYEEEPCQRLINHLKDLLKTKAFVILYTRTEGACDNGLARKFFDFVAGKIGFFGDLKERKSQQLIVLGLRDGDLGVNGRNKWFKAAATKRAVVEAAQQVLNSPTQDISWKDGSGFCQMYQDRS